MVRLILKSINPMAKRRKSNVVPLVWCVAALLCACFLSCNRKEKEMINLMSEDSLNLVSREWRNDSLGCARHGDPQKISRLITQLGLIGNDSSELVKYLGTPDGRRRNQNEVTSFYYDLGCGLHNNSGYRFICSFENGKLYHFEAVFLD